MTGAWHEGYRAYPQMVENPYGAPELEENFLAREWADGWQAAMFDDMERQCQQKSLTK